MNQIKMVALDMDGTLLNHDSQISAKNREAIQRVKADGVDVVLSTGRFIGSVREYAQLLQLSSYFITLNGSEIWKGQELIQRHALDSKWIAWIRDLAVAHNAFYWGMTTNHLYSTGNFPDHVASCTWLKIGLHHPDDRIRTTIWEQLQETGELELTNSEPENIEVNAKGVSKATGLAQVCRQKQITMANVLAIGDSLNDKTMIEQAGYGIAMGNAQPEIKAIANAVTATNIEDGVAQALATWL